MPGSLPPEPFTSSSRSPMKPNFPASPAGSWGHVTKSFPLKCECGTSATSGLPCSCLFLWNTIWTGQPGLDHAEDSKVQTGDRKVEGARLPELCQRGMPTLGCLERGTQTTPGLSHYSLGLFATEAWPTLMTKISKIIITILWKQPKCPTIGDGFSELWYVHKI